MTSNQLTRGVCLLGLTLAVLTGCERFEAGTADESKETMTSEDRENVGTAAQRPVTIETVDRAGFDAVVGRHRGDVVLVDFWATWCGPCKERFPHTVQLHRQFGEKGLAVVTVSLDDPADDQIALDYLKSQGATFDNLLSAYGVGVKGFEAFQIPEAIPYFTLYDRQGRLRYRFSPVFQSAEEGQSLDQIDIRVRELLLEEA